MIVTGGANVYPAQVEAVLSSHPAVRDVAVIGLPDSDMGKVVHALVEMIDPGVTDAELLSYCSSRLSHEKVPRTMERLEHLPRDEAGKIRKVDLVNERTTVPG